jgi:hypothetical protein
MVEDCENNPYTRLGIVTKMIGGSVDHALNFTVEMINCLLSFADEDLPLTSGKI